MKWMCIQIDWILKFRAEPNRTKPGTKTKKRLNIRPGKIENRLLQQYWNKSHVNGINRNRLNEIKWSHKCHLRNLSSIEWVSLPSYHMKWFCMLSYVQLWALCISLLAFLINFIDLCRICLADNNTKLWTNFGQVCKYKYHAMTTISICDISIVGIRLFAVGLVAIAVLILTGQLSAAAIFYTPSIDCEKKFSPTKSKKKLVDSISLHARYACATSAWMFDTCSHKFFKDDNCIRAPSDWFG